MLNKMQSYVYPSDDVLHKLYWDENLSPSDIGERFGIPKGSISNRLRSRGIGVRSCSDAAKVAYAMHRKPRSVSPRKDVVSCPRCFFTWRNTEPQQVVSCPICSRVVDIRKRKSPRKMVDGLRQWRESVKSNPDAIKESGRRTRERLRRKVLAIIAHGGPIVCATCGCADMRLLEVNHINGGGNKEYHHGERSMQFYYRVVRLERTVDDLNILCKVCNARHYLELKYGELPYTIMWAGEESSK